MRKDYGYINLPVSMIDKIDGLINSPESDYSSRAEFVKDAVRRFIEKFPDPSGPAAAEFSEPASSLHTGEGNVTSGGDGSGGNSEISTRTIPSEPDNGEDGTTVVPPRHPVLPSRSPEEETGRIYREGKDGEQHGETKQ